MLAFFLSVCALCTMDSFAPVDGTVVKNYTIQLRFFVDPSGVKKWTENTGGTDMEDLRKEIHSRLVDVTEMYSSLTNYYRDIAFSFEILNITILDKNLFEIRESGTKAIAKFHEWILPSYEKEPYDIALLITGLSMTGGIGFGYTGHICTDKSVGVVPMTSTFRDAIVWAHEMGHILGAQHDYMKNEGDRCHTESGMVMNPNVRNQPKENNFIFSDCSGSYINYGVEQLDKKGINCLLDGGQTVSAPKFSSYITPDMMCERAFGKNSFADPKPYKRRPSEICLKLHCQVKKPWKYLYYADFTWSIPGMKCGKNKICIKGKCVEDPAGNPLVSDECPLGDQLRTGYEKYWEEKCAEIDIRDCKYYAQDCCHTCNTTNPIYTMTADEICEAMHGPGSALRRGGYRKYGDELCSELKCISGRVGKFESKSFETPDGMVCGKNKRCSQNKCVESRHGDTAIEDSCPFGDQDLKSLGYKGSCSQQNCLPWKNWCCKSCEGSI